MVRASMVIVSPVQGAILIPVWQPKKVYVRTQIAMAKIYQNSKAYQVRYSLRLCASAFKSRARK